MNTPRLSRFALLAFSLAIVLTGILFLNFLDSERANTRLDFEQAAQAPGWLSVMRGDEQPETEEYGISSFVFRADRPFHPRRFWDFLHANWLGVLRSKGWFWLATRPKLGGVWSLAGGSGIHQCAGYWSTGPRQELVFIGQNMERDLMLGTLERALLTDSEMFGGEMSWAGLDDPFPAWRETAQTDDAAAV